MTNATTGGAVPPSGGALRGDRLTDGCFRVIEADAYVGMDLKQVFSEEAVAYVVHDYLSQDACQRITENFKSNLSLHERTNGVSAKTVGVDLYRAEPTQYMVDVRERRVAVDALFDGTVYVPDLLMADIQAHLPGIEVRSARHEGEAMNRIRGVAWTDTGKYALKLHDDQAQLYDPRQETMETYRVRAPFAFNVYPSVSQEGGALTLVNIAPNAETRTRLGIAHVGYPYAEELVEEFERIVIRPRAGDLVVVAGRYVHGVRGVSGAGMRLLLNTFGGFVNSRTFVLWS